MKTVEDLAQELHNWYLEATKTLSPKSFNPDAQKSYNDLTNEQQFIDIFIANKIREVLLKETRKDEKKKTLEEVEKIGIKVKKHQERHILIREGDLLIEKEYWEKLKND